MYTYFQKGCNWMEYEKFLSKLPKDCQYFQSTVYTGKHKLPPQTTHTYLIIITISSLEFTHRVLT